MASNMTLFAGVELSSGRRPVTFAALDRELQVITLETWTMRQTIAYLQGYEKAILVMDQSSSKANLLQFEKTLAKIQFGALSKQREARQYVGTDSQEAFHALVGSDLLPRRSLEGRIQRSLILYDEGFQIPDPMDFFEEITRHKLILGELPVENLYSSRQLSALISAYIAWMTVNRPGQIEVLKNIALPKSTLT